MAAAFASIVAAFAVTVQLGISAAGVLAGRGGPERQDRINPADSQNDRWLGATGSQP